MDYQALYQQKLTTPEQAVKAAVADYYKRKGMPCDICESCDCVHEHIKAGME